jgi:hypothetical protein
MRHADCRGRVGWLLLPALTNGVRTVIVEDASRFAHHLMTQETGIATLIGLKVRVLAANGDDLTDTDDEFRIAMRPADRSAVRRRTMRFEDKVALATGTGVRPKDKVCIVTGAASGIGSMLSFDRRSATCFIGLSRALS